jgi:hypothetical protein
MDLENQLISKKGKINIIDNNEENKEIDENINKNVPYKGNTSWIIKDIGEIDPNLTDYEKNVLLKGTYSVNDLLEKEKEEKPIIQDKNKVFITKVKCIALHKLGYHPLSNPSNMTDREKKKIIKKMQKILNDKTEEQITARFNKLVLDDILSERADYTKYCIYEN